MKRLILFGLLILTLATAVAARPAAVPLHAAEVAPGLYHLGFAIDEGRLVEGYAVVDGPRAHRAKPGTVCGNGICEAGENAKKCPADCGGGGNDTGGSSSCYGFIANGAGWNNAEPYVINPANNEGLSTGYVTSTFDAGVDKWEATVGQDLVGAQSITAQQLVADTSSTDGVNEVYFGSAGGNTIGYTIVWGVFRGPPSQRRLVEWDMVFNQASFNWGIADPGKMDFDNIATHELGHTMGLGDLYNAECSEETMFGSAGNGETKKRSLEAGDIAGMNALY